MKDTLCFSYGGSAPFIVGKRKRHAMIELRQQGRDRFSVRYGLQFRERLNYGEAARELGECIMHLQACNSLLDNREPGER